MTNLKPDTVELFGRTTIRIIRRLPLIYEDLRPGQEGRRASMTLVRQPSIERLRYLFDYDDASGELRWKNPAATKIKPGDVAGAVFKNHHVFYRRTEIDGVKYRNHVLVWTFVNGEWPSMDLNHFNGNGLDNRIENLRPATPTETQQSRHWANRGSTSRYKGVSWYRACAKWRADIKVGRGTYLGDFAVERAAALAYDAAARLAFGRFACLNFDASASAEVVLPARVIAKIENLATSATRPATS